jgi:hypothetical protein
MRLVLSASNSFSNKEKYIDGNREQFSQHGGFYSILNGLIMLKKIYKRLFWDQIRLYRFFRKDNNEVDAASHSFYFLHIGFFLSFYFFITFFLNHKASIETLIVFFLPNIFSKKLELLFKSWKKEYVQKNVKIKGVNFFLLYLLLMVIFLLVSLGLYVEKYGN